MEIIDKTHNDVSTEESARCDALQADVLAVLEKHGVTDYVVFAVIDGKVESSPEKDGIVIHGLSTGFDAIRPPFALDFAKKTTHLARMAMTFQKILSMFGGDSPSLPDLIGITRDIHEMNGNKE